MCAEYLGQNRYLADKIFGAAFGRKSLWDCYWKGIARNVLVEEKICIFGWSYYSD